VEGALAPDPLASSRAKGEPLRELPGLRKKERTWKDEVRERVRHRKQTRHGELPLFPEGEEPPPAITPEIPETPEVVSPKAEILELEEEPDLSLRPPLSFDDQVAEAAEASRRLVLDEAPPERGGEDWPLGAPEIPEQKPVERPARVVERVQAGAIDLALLSAIWIIVVYFASRAAHVAIPGLRPSWPYLLGYLAFLGFFYAGYFTGTTGQTIGKILGGLRVVDTAGRPPGYFRAVLRAALALLSFGVVFLGTIPMFLDPAGRAAHDRILRTRVIKG
jgi:uncharacterized RDD family membrane protein YckC